VSQLGQLVLHGRDDFRVQVTGVQYRDAASEVDEFTTFDVSNGGVLRGSSKDRVDLANTARNSGVTALHHGFVSLAHEFLIHRSSGGVVQGLSSRLAVAAAFDDRLLQLPGCQVAYVKLLC
jgi:hypothetical protein